MLYNSTNDYSKIAFLSTFLTIENEVNYFKRGNRRFDHANQIII